MKTKRKDKAENLGDTERGRKGKKDGRGRHKQKDGERK